MRRVIASLILSLSLIVASGSWAGFILTRTALDPGRSERLADQLLDNTVVRGVIVNELTDAVESQVPSSVPIPRQTIEVAANEALDDPRVEAVVRDGFVRAHQNALNGVDEPVRLDASVLGQVGREKAVALSPELDAVLPAAPPLTVDLPTGGLSFLGTLRNSILRYTRLGALLASAGVLVAIVITTKRPKAFRRISYWAFANSAFWLLVAFGLPALIGQVAPSSMSIATALIDVFFGAMIRPAMYMAVAGVALLGLSFVWPAIAKRRPAGMVDRPAPAPGALHQQRPVLEGLSATAGAPMPDPSFRAYEQPPAAPPVFQTPADGAYEPYASAPSAYQDPHRYPAPDVIQQAYDQSRPATAPDVAGSVPDWANPPSQGVGYGTDPYRAAPHAADPYGGGGRRSDPYSVDPVYGADNGTTDFGFLQPDAPTQQWITKEPPSSGYGVGRDDELDVVDPGFGPMPRSPDGFRPDVKSPAPPPVTHGRQAYESVTDLRPGADAPTQPPVPPSAFPSAPPDPTAANAGPPPPDAPPPTVPADGPGTVPPTPTPANAEIWAVEDSEAPTRVWSTPEEPTEVDPTSRPHTDGR